MLTNKAAFLPFQSSIEQSPKCLIPSHPDPCNHKYCLMAYKRPQWHGISISEFYNKEQFTDFDVNISDHPRLKDHSHIIPHNPNPCAKDGFEVFRQAMNSVLSLAGVWPSNLKVVPREHVEIRWAEYMSEYPYTNPETFETVWLQRLDVQEYAYYIGPKMEPVISIDISVIEKPTKGYTFIDCTQDNSDLEKGGQSEC